GSKRNTHSPWRELREGFRVILGNRDMLAILYVTLLVNALVYPIFQTFMPVFAKDVFHVGPSGLGLLLTCSGVGALIGAILAASLGDFRWKGQLFLWGAFAYGLFFVLFAFSPWFPLSLVLIGMVGLALSTFQVMQWALMLILAPPEVRGLSMGVLLMAIGIQPLAALGLGAITTALGISLTTAVAGSLLAINMIALYFWLPSLRHLR
ncbi:MAG: MFS transporter, partial [Chloroflexi bacterium]|nr:MFS transporter [Chloroflexota bacterium]